MTKEDLLTLLWQNADAYISGEELARRLSVSRTAVWKAIGQLREAGYNIESVSNRGYRLLSESDVLSEEPPRNDNPLLAPDIPRLILTPHSAWGRSRFTHPRRAARASVFCAVFIFSRPFFDPCRV